MGVRRDHQLTLVVLLRELRRGELAPAGERCAGHLGPADDVLLITQVVAVPVLEEHLNPSGHQVAATPHPGLVRLVTDPDVAIQEIGLLGLDVARAVLEPQQIARRRLRGAGRGRLAEPELHPVVARPPRDRAGRGSARHGRPPTDRQNRPGCRGLLRHDRDRDSRWAGTGGRRAAPASSGPGQTSRRRGRGRTRW